MAVKHPLISWAQRLPHVYISVEVDNMKIQELTVSEDSFKIKGTRGEDVYEADLQLFGKLKGDERRQIATDRRVELVIPKAEPEWWPRLLKEKSKVPWIKVDFDKWKDEDEDTGNDDLGFGGMGGMDNLDFSQFGGMPGMPGGGVGKNWGMDDLDDDEDDEEMGELEDIPKEGDDAGAEPSASTTNNNNADAPKPNGEKGGDEAKTAEASS